MDLILPRPLSPTPPPYHNPACLATAEYDYIPTNRPMASMTIGHTHVLTDTVGNWK